jgi:hypothetical protein
VINNQSKRRAERTKKVDINSFPKTIEKVCRECGKLSPHKWAYHILANGQPEYRHICVTCMKDYLRDYHKQYAIGNKEELARKHLQYAANNREYIRKYNKNLKRDKKKKAIVFKGGACKICGYNKNPNALGFHHEDTDKKTAELGELMCRSWERIEKELKHCVLLCSNCHQELHAKDEDSKYRRNKEKAVEYLGGKCELCGYNKDRSALVFHHKNPMEKEGRVKLLGKWVKAKEELDKCQLLCANCHFELHSNE